MREEEESWLWLASEQEKRWLVELAEQQWREWMAEEQVEETTRRRRLVIAGGAECRRRYVSDQGKYISFFFDTCNANCCTLVLAGHVCSAQPPKKNVC